MLYKLYNIIIKYLIRINNFYPRTSARPYQQIFAVLLHWYKLRRNNTICKLWTLFIDYLNL